MTTNANIAAEFLEIAKDRVRSIERIQAKAGALADSFDEQLWIAKYDVARMEAGRWTDAEAAAIRRGGWSWQSDRDGHAHALRCARA